MVHQVFLVWLFLCSYSIHSIQQNNSVCSECII